MYAKKVFLVALVSLLSLVSLQAESTDLNLTKLNGNWHLRVMDGMEVRKARAILDFDAEKMQLSGFDGCNRIHGALEKNSTNIMSAKLISTRMACRENIHSYVSQRLQEAVAEGFSIKEEMKYDIQGITLKSAKHELFFKRMGKD